MDNLNIEKKIQDILNKNLLNAKRELLLFVNQTKETIQYKTDKQGYIKELLADYSKLSINKDGTINFIGRSYINSGYPLLSDDDLLAMMRQFYLGYANNPRLGENVAIAAAESDGRVFLERWSKYNWLKTLLDMLVQPQQVQASTPLPVELQTDEAIERFDRAEKAGIILRTATGYEKNNITKAQLAYFLQRIYQADPQSGKQFPETKLNNLFGESRLGKAAGKLVDNNSGKPRGYNIIDDLFID